MIASHFTWVRCISGAVLLAAAGLKVQQLVTDPVAGVTLFSWLFVIGQIGFETTLGSLLITGKHVEPVRLIALASFSIFAFVALYRTITGLPSCGCFGKLHVPPLYTAMFDLLAVLGLALFPPPTSSRNSRRAGLVLAGITLVALSAMAVGRNWIRASAFTTLEQSSSFTAAGGIVLLEAEQWIGKRLAILDYIDIADRLRSGRWTLVLYHHDCSACIAAIPGYERMAREEHEKTGQSHVALIEMPPYAAAGENPVPASSLCVLGKLSDQREWFATTPVAIELRDAIVTRASDGNVAHAQLRSAP